MYVSIGSDHRGVAARLMIAHMLKVQGDDIFCEYGPSNEQEVWDYPFPAFQVAGDVSEGKAQRGVVICGSGIGVTIAANKVRGVRAALCRTPDDARMCREHNDCNVLCLGQDAAESVAGLSKILHAFLCTDHSKKERHRRRVRTIRVFEEKGAAALQDVPAEESVIQAVKNRTCQNKFCKPLDGDYHQDAADDPDQQHKDFVAQVDG